MYKGVFVNWCRKCRFFSKNFFWEGGRRTGWKCKTSDFFEANIRTFEAKHRNFTSKKSDVSGFRTGSEPPKKKAEKRGECPLRRGFGSVFRPFFNQDGAEIQSVRYGSLNATPYAKRRGHRHRAWSRWSLPFARLQCGAPEGRSRPWGVRVQTGTLQRCPRDGIRRHAP